MSGVRLGHVDIQLEGLAAGEHSGTGQGQEAGPDPGPQAALGTLAVGIPSCGCVVSPQAHTWQWRPVTGWPGGMQTCSWRSQPTSSDRQLWVGCLD